MTWTESAAKTVAGIKQGSGVVGKLCTVACIAFLAMGAGLFAMPSDGWKAAATLVGVLITGGTLLGFAWLTLGFAKDNPNAAGMESNDLLQAHLKQLEVATKGQAASVPTANVAPPEVETAPTARASETTS